MLRERGNYCIQVCIFIHPSQSPKIVCNPKVSLFCWVDFRSKFKDHELVYMWPFERTINKLIGVKFLCWRIERGACTYVNSLSPTLRVLHPLGHFTLELESPWPVTKKLSAWSRNHTRSKFIVHKTLGAWETRDIERMEKSTWCPTWHQVHNASGVLSIALSPSKKGESNTKLVAMMSN